MLKLRMFLVFFCFSMLLSSFVSAIDTDDNPYGGGRTEPDLPWDPSEGNWEVNNSEEDRSSQGLMPSINVILLLLGIIVLLIVVVLVTILNKN